MISSLKVTIKNSQNGTNRCRNFNKIRYRCFNHICLQCQHLFIYLLSQGRHHHKHHPRSSLLGNSTITESKVGILNSRHGTKAYRLLWFQTEINHILEITCYLYKKLRDVKKGRRNSIFNKLLSIVTLLIAKLSPSPSTNFS